MYQKQRQKDKDLYYCSTDKLACSRENISQIWLMQRCLLLCALQDYTDVLLNILTYSCLPCVNIVSDTLPLCGRYSSLSRYRLGKLNDRVMQSLLLINQWLIDATVTKYSLCVVCVYLCCYGTVNISKSATDIKHLLDVGNKQSTHKLCVTMWKYSAVWCGALPHTRIVQLLDLNPKENVWKDEAQKTFKFCVLRMGQNAFITNKDFCTSDVFTDCGLICGSVWVIHH